MDASFEPHLNTSGDSPNLQKREIPATCRHPMDLDCAIILCTHNPRRDYLSRALESIKAQTLTKDRWELLLVDNASKERLEGSWDLSWHPNGRHVREDELGLTPARLRGIRESKAPILVYADDDGLLAPDYLEASLSLFKAHHQMGVIGAGALTPEFETPPAARFQRVLHYLAIRDVPRSVWSNNPEDAMGIPYGAGLCVRRVIALHYLDLLERMNANDYVDRRGSELTCGGDNLFSCAAAFHGMGFGVFPELRITHLISATRVSDSYFLRLVEAHGFSHTIIGHLLNISPATQLDWLASLRRLLSVTRYGLFDARIELAAQRGRRRGCRFVTERALKIGAAIGGIAANDPKPIPSA